MGNQYYKYGGTDFTIPAPYERETPADIGVSKHGTPAGYSAHHRRKVPMCMDCANAEVKRSADRRAKKKAGA